MFNINPKQRKLFNLCKKKYSRTKLTRHEILSTMKEAKINTYLPARIAELVVTDPETGIVYKGVYEVAPLLKRRTKTEEEKQQESQKKEERKTVPFPITREQYRLFKKNNNIDSKTEAFRKCFEETLPQYLQIRKVLPNRILVAPIGGGWSASDIVFDVPSWAYEITLEDSLSNDY